MSTSTYYFTGKCKWAKLRTPDDKYKNYTIDLYPDKETWTKFKDSGAQLKIRTNDDGEEYFTLKRPASKIIKDEMVNMGPPVLLQSNNTPLPSDIDVGNGSDVTCKVLVYDTVKGKGHTLEVVRVDKLVKYTKPFVDQAVDLPF